MDKLLKLMHDTMSPVATIKGSVQLMKERKLTPEETIMLLDAIEERADRLNATLDAFYVQMREEEDSK